MKLYDGQGKGAQRPVLGVGELKKTVVRSAAKTHKFLSLLFKKMSSGSYNSLF